MRKSLCVFTFLVGCCLVHAQQPTKYVVYFASGKYAITDEALRTLEQGIKDNSLLLIDSVKVFAYCDTIGGLLYNDTLAQNRAEAIRAYLAMRRAGREGFIEVKTFGERVPLNNNSNEKLRALNRRAEVLFFAHNNLKQETESAVTTIDTTTTEDRAASVDSTVNALQKMRSVLSTLEAGKKFRLPNLNFYGSRHFVVPSSFATLDTLVAILKSYPEMEIEIQGYVCCVPVGKEAYDVTERRYNLSSTRAEAIYNDLVKNGIAPARLKHKGYGSQPMVAEVTDEDKALNRRVEIKILKR